MSEGVRQMTIGLAETHCKAAPAGLLALYSTITIENSDGGHRHFHFCDEPSLFDFFFRPASLATALSSHL
jgi:hypothetical protein